jgi:hypothetical protein
MTPVRTRILVAVLAAALFAAGCSGDDGTVGGTGTTAATTVVPDASIPPGATAAPGEPGDTTPATPATPATPTTQGLNPPLTGTVVLRPDGLGVVAFGASKVDVITTLSSEVGQLDETGTGCEAAGPSASTARWDELRVQFIGPTFDSYNVRPPNGVAPVLDLETEEGIGLGSTVADLEAAYGDRLTIPGLPPEFGGNDFAISFLPDTDKQILGSLSDTTDAGTVTGIFTQVCE